MFKQKNNLKVFNLKINVLRRNCAYVFFGQNFLKVFQADGSRPSSLSAVAGQFSVKLPNMIKNE